jgi:acyl carrier protein phosphodiesterase
MRDVVSEDAMNVVEGFKQTTGANASAVQDLEDTSDSSDFETARTTLSEQGKSDILSAFKRNLRNLLRRRADSRVGKPKKPKSRPSEFRIDPNDADWERTVMQQVHKDVMEAFEHKVKASIHDWFNIPDPQDQSSGQDKSFSQQHKTPNTDSGTSSDTDTDASSWKQIPHVADVPMGTITISPALTRSSTFSRKYPSPLNPSANVNEEEENEDDYWGPTAIPNVDPTSTTTSTTTITIARNYTRLRPYSSPLTTIPTLNEDADEYWGPTMSARDEAPQPTALYRRDHADYSDQVNTDDDSLTSDASDWERQILNNVHKDVMEAFADKNRAELWRQNHPDEPLPNYLRTKKPISNKGDQQLKGNPDLSYKPLTTDSSESSDWEGQLLDKVHKDVMEAFADKNRAKLWKQNHPGQPVPDWVLRTMKPMSNRRYQQLKGNLPVEPEHEIQDHRRVFSGLKTATSDPSPSSSPRRRSRKARRAASPTAPVPAPKRTLKALLQDSDTCVQDPECDIETADFVKGLDKKDSREQLLAWCRGFCERDPESCRAIGCDRYLYEYGDYVD